jgi:hypothetical protein
MSKTLRTGSCHCRALRYEVEIDLDQPVSRCNCTICTKLGVTGAIVKPEDLKSVTGETSARTYGNQIGNRYFCGTCGIHCYGRGHLAELGGDYVSINANTLDGVDPRDFKVVYFDGRHDNWHAGTRNEPWPI